MSIKTAIAPVAQTAERIVRPVRYAGAGIKGTATGLLDGMAQYGRKGLLAGLGVGIFVGIAATSLGYVFMLAFAGFAAGAVGGAALGAVKGAYGGVTLEARRDKYADQAAERGVARHARSQNYNRASYRDVQASRKTISNYNFERYLQQSEENREDYGSTWRDRVSSEQNNGQGRGF